MTATAPDLTPPTKAAKTPKEPKAAAAPKEPKAPKVPKEPKVAKARGNYGYHTDATIELVPEKETKYRGQRAEWFEEVKKFNGKKVKEFNEALAGKTNGKGTVQTPSGWLRFYVLDGSVKLTGAPVAEAAPASTPASPAAA